jgi:hypothetical protein
MNAKDIFLKGNNNLVNVWKLKGNGESSNLNSSYKSLEMKTPGKV